VRRAASAPTSVALVVPLVEALMDVLPGLAPPD
jgi:hypothetical protein